jgi:tRNA uridine 5-carboxymethylaminomethyl modification enzyme
MFTSRAERRLLLRIDNADLRLTPLGREIGLIDDARWERFKARESRYARNLDILAQGRVGSGPGEGSSAARLVREPNMSLAEMVARGEVSLVTDDADREVDLASLEASVRYAGYLRREAHLAEKAQKDENRRIPEGFPFERIPGLSCEVVQRLSQVRPETIGQASRIPGVTAGAVAVLGVFVARLGSGASSAGSSTMGR